MKSYLNHKISRILFWGTYDKSKPRVRLLLKGLEDSGVEILEIHSDLWKGVRDKSTARSAAWWLWFSLRALCAYISLIARYLIAPKHDAVFVGYLGQLDILLIWPFAKLRRRQLAWDAFLSLYNTVIEDRQLSKKEGIIARFIKAWEGLACRAADRIVLDTQAHADYFSNLYKIPPTRFNVVFVGAEELFFNSPKKLNLPEFGQDTVILFYGQFIPLHGLDTIVEAAALAGNHPWRWVIIGDGQEASRIDKKIEHLALGNITRIKWIAYEELIAWLQRADLCLGIFGDTRKAAMVIPNKVFQIIAAERPLITRDSPAIAELEAGADSIMRIPPSNPKALIKAIEELISDEPEIRQNSGKVRQQVQDTIEIQINGLLKTLYVKK